MMTVMTCKRVGDLDVMECFICDLNRCPEVPGRIRLWINNKWTEVVSGIVVCTSCCCTLFILIFCHFLCSLGMS